MASAKKMHVTGAVTINSQKLKQTLKVIIAYKLPPDVTGNKLVLSKIPT